MKHHWRWWAIAAVILVGVTLYTIHLAVGYTPNRVAFSVAGIEFYWSAVIITLAVFLSTAVVAHLAQRQAQWLFQQIVPAAVRHRPLAALPLTQALKEKLERQRFIYVGPLLYHWGLNPRYINLTDTELTQLGGTLVREEHIAESWIVKPLWRPWNPLHAWYSLGWIAIFGLVGGRLYHILAPSPDFVARTGLSSAAAYWNNPFQIISLRQGGLGLWGAFLGGLIGLIIYAIRARLPLLMWADIAVVGLALGQAIGRWGDFFNQQLYGRPTAMPWAVAIDPAYRLSTFEVVTTYHPLFLYESLWSLALFFLLYHLASRYVMWLHKGDLLALYVIGYAIGRLLFESIRIDSAYLSLGTLSIPIATAVALSLLFLMAAWRRFHY